MKLGIVGACSAWVTVSISSLLKSGSVVMLTAAAWSGQAGLVGGLPWRGERCQQGRSRWRRWRNHIAAASWAHISAYCARWPRSFAVFWPKKFVAISASQTGWPLPPVAAGSLRMLARRPALLPWLDRCLLCLFGGRTANRYREAATAIDSAAGPR